MTAIRKNPLEARLSAMRQVRTPRGTRWFARVLVVLFFVSPFAIAQMPWQQSFHATGRVVAFDPRERQLDIEAPVDGRITRWHVVEGQEVKEGDLLVEIRDPDPDLPRRLDEQKYAIEERMAAARARIESFSAQVKSLQTSRDRALEAANSRYDMSVEREKAADQAVTVAKERLRLDTLNYRMEKDLRADGLTSQLVFETATARQRQAEAEKDRAASTLQAAREEMKALKADVETVRNNADAGIASAKASRQSAEAELASAMRDLSDLKIRIARQNTQEVRACSDGTVFRILANADRGGALVKSGDRLAIVTPTIHDASKRTVELLLDGNDSPQLLKLIDKWKKEGKDGTVCARVQFEGWPALQFVGWPSMAWGTFGGKVVFVDPHDDGKGRFRVLVQPDEEQEQGDWPDGFELRQGTRAQGWLLLERVPLWYELWRRFNGFPPVVAGKDEDGAKAKPAKAKVPK